MNEPFSWSQLMTRVSPWSAGELPSPNEFRVSILPRSFDHSTLPCMSRQWMPWEPKNA